MFKLNVVAIVFGEIWQLRECRVGAILLVFVDNRANFPTHTMHRSAVGTFGLLIKFLLYYSLKKSSLSLKNSLAQTFHF